MNIQYPLKYIINDKLNQVNLPQIKVSEIKLDYQEKQIKKTNDLIKQSKIIF